MAAGQPTKSMGIYMAMAPPKERAYPMKVEVLASTKIEDLIGFICWQYTRDGRLPQLQSDFLVSFFFPYRFNETKQGNSFWMFFSEAIDLYALHIAEDDGEVDLDFPALDSREPIAKFDFARLALVERILPRRHMSSFVVTMYVTIRHNLIRTCPV